MTKYTEKHVKYVFGRVCMDLLVIRMGHQRLRVTF